MRRRCPEMSENVRSGLIVSTSDAIETDGSGTDAFAAERTQSKPTRNRDFRREMRKSALGGASPATKRTHCDLRLQFAIWRMGPKRRTALCKVQFSIRGSIANCKLQIASRRRGRLFLRPSVPALAVQAREREPAGGFGGVAVDLVPLVDADALDQLVQQPGAERVLERVAAGRIARQRAAQHQAVGVDEVDGVG